MEFIVTNSKNNYGCKEIKSPFGTLVFRPPDGPKDDILIQTIKVEEKRKKHGTALINKLKEIAINHYSSARIRVMDIEPIEKGVSLEALIMFYEKNGFIVTKIDNDLTEGIYTALR